MSGRGGRCARSATGARATRCRACLAGGACSAWSSSAPVGVGGLVERRDGARPRAWSCGAAREIVARLNDPETGGRYERWVERARGCRHPVRLRGASREADAATGEVVREFASEGEPDGVLLTPCGNRRAHVCPSCSEVYRGDAWQLVAAGLRGGKGVPGVGRASIRWCSRPSRRRASGRCTRSARARTASGSPCRPRSRGETCPHGRSLACGERHARGRSVPGRGDLPGLLRLRAAARCGTTTRAGCSSARGPTSSASSPARPASRRRPRASGCACPTSKVAEFQRRGVVHFHTALAPRRPRDDDELVPPPAEFDAQLLVDAITAALPKATVPAEDADADPYGWGTQHEVRALDLARRSARGGARGRLHRQVRDQVHRGRRRRRATGSRTRTSWTACAAASTRAG